MQLLGMDLDATRKEQQAIWTKIKYLEEEIRVIDEQIKLSQDHFLFAYS